MSFEPTHRFNVVACTLCAKAQGYKPTTGDIPLFLAPEQYVFVTLDYNSLLLTLQLPDTLTPEVQQYLWSVSPKCISMKFVVGGSPLCVGIRSSSLSLEKCCHGLFIPLFFCSFSVEGCLSELSVHNRSMVQGIRVEVAALDSSASLSHETLSAHPHHPHLQWLAHLHVLRVAGRIET